MAQNSDDPVHPDVSGQISHRLEGAGVPSPDDVERRAGEIAITEGFQASEANEKHRNQARRELSGEQDRPSDVVAESTELYDRDPVIGSSGHQAPTMGPADEQSVGERLYAQGVDEATHDRMVAGSEALEHRERGLGAEDGGN